MSDYAKVYIVTSITGDVVCIMRVFANAKDAEHFHTRTAIERGNAMTEEHEVVGAVRIETGLLR